jgi:hypothetical protein
VPAIGDANSVRWILHSGLLEDIVTTDGLGRTLRLRIVGLLAHGLFQGELVVAEGRFLEAFSSTSGHPWFLFETPPEVDAVALGRALEKDLADSGFSARTTARSWPATRPSRTLTSRRSRCSAGSAYSSGRSGSAWRCRGAWTSGGESSRCCGPSATRSATSQGSFLARLPSSSLRACLRGRLRGPRRGPRGAPPAIDPAVGQPGADARPHLSDRLDVDPDGAARCSASPSDPLIARRVAGPRLMAFAPRRS